MRRTTHFHNLELHLKPVMQAINKIIKYFSRRESKEPGKAKINIISQNESENQKDNQEKLLAPCEEFAKSVLCLQFKREIDQILNLQWMTENYGHKEEELSLSNMQVRNMSEFLEKINDPNSEVPEGAKRSRLRRYELVEKRQALAGKSS